MTSALDTQLRESQWQNMLDSFQSFGGIAENITQRQGEHGLGLFPVDESKQVKLIVPKHLLVEYDNVERQNDQLVLLDHKDYPEGFPDWFTNYQSNFSWGADGRRSIDEFEQGLKALPTETLQLLDQNNLLKPAGRWPEEDWDDLIMKRFLRSRCIRVKTHEKPVLIPIIELINHSPKMSSYKVDEDICIEDTFSGEILVSYQLSDPIRRFLAYGFSCHEAVAFSLPILAPFGKKNKLCIKGEVHRVNSMPKVEKNEGDLSLSHVLLSSTSSPRVPKTIFIKCLMDEIDLKADEIFEQIYARNIRTVVSIANSLGTDHSKTADGLRTACLNHLWSLSHQYGLRMDML